MGEGGEKRERVGSAGERQGKSERVRTEQRAPGRAGEGQGSGTSGRERRPGEGQGTAQNTGPAAPPPHRTSGPARLPPRAAGPPPQPGPRPSASVPSLARGGRDTPQDTHRGRTEEQAPTNRAADPPSTHRLLAPRPAPRAVGLRHHVGPPLAKRFRPCPHSPAVECAGSGSSAVPPLRRRRAPPTAVGHIEAGGWGEVKRSLFSFTKMAARPCFATVLTL